MFVVICDGNEIIFSNEADAWNAYDELAKYSNPQIPLQIKSDCAGTQPQ